MKNYTKVNLTSSDLSLEKQEELRRILPEAFSEDKIDWEKLRTVLGDSVDERVEKFSFSWAGKSDAIKSVLIPSKGTLRADKDESIKFDESENIFIEGDNLEALKLLQKAYFEKVKMIYIDPPYNTGGDFVYRDNFAAPLKGYLQQTGQVDDEGNKLQTNKETNGRFHSDWLSMMYPRLKLAWNLLKDDGVIFVSIDDNEVHRLRVIMDEVFGEESFVCQLVWNTKESSKGVPPIKMVTDIHEYILVYQKTNFKFNGILRTTDDFSNPDNDSRGLWRKEAVVSTISKKTFEIVDPKTGNVFNRAWAFSPSSMQRMIGEGRIFFPKTATGTPLQKKFFNDYTNESVPINTQIGTFQSRKATSDLLRMFDGKKIFDFPKPVELLKFLVGQATQKDSIVLDFFAGSGALAHAVMAQNIADKGNRKWICVQLPEKTEQDSEAYKMGFKTIAEIAKERIRRVINGYGENPQPIEDGFKVFKLGESNYPENQFEFDPEKSEEENKKAFDSYLVKAKQVSLFDEVNASDVIYENIVKEGFSLNAKIAVSKIAENTVSIVSDGEMQFLICLDKKINEGAIRALTEAEYKGKTFICFDSALDDTAKANLGLNIELKTI